MKRLVAFLSLLFVLLLVTKFGAAQTNKTIDSLQNALASSNSRLEKAATHKELAQTYLSAYDLRNAQKYAQKSLKVSKELKLDSLTQLSYKILGVAYAYQNKIDSSLYYLNASNRIAHKLKDSTVLAKNYGILSNIYNQFLNEPDKAFLYIDTAENYCGNSRIDELVFSKIVKGTIFINVTSYHLALKEFYAGLDLVEDDSTKITSLYNNIGTVFKSTGDYKEARKNYLQAINYSQNDPRSLGMAYHNLALVYRLEEKPMDAIEQEEQAIYYLNQLGTNSYLLQAQLTYGQINNELGNKMKAFEAFEAIDTTGQIPQDRLLWNTLGPL